MDGESEQTLALTSNGAALLEVSAVESSDPLRGDFSFHSQFRTKPYSGRRAGM